MKIGRRGLEICPFSPFFGGERAPTLSPTCSLKREGNLFESETCG